MQTLHKKQKIAISVGVTAILAAIGIVAALMSVSSGIDSPKLEVPVPGNNVPEMIVTPKDSSVSKGMPVPGNNVPEMIVTPDEAN